MSERDKLPRWVLWLGLAFAGAWLLFTLRGVLAPVFFAFLIAYMLDPLVDRIEGSRLLRGRSYGRGVGIAVILAGFFVVAALGVLVIVPMVYEEVANFLRRLPDLVARSRAEWEPMLAEYGIAIPTSVCCRRKRLPAFAGRRLEGHARRGVGADGDAGGVDADVAVARGIDRPKSRRRWARGRPNRSYRPSPKSRPTTPTKWQKPPALPRPLTSSGQVFSQQWRLSATSLQQYLPRW